MICRVSQATNFSLRGDWAIHFLCSIALSLSIIALGACATTPDLDATSPKPAAQPQFDPISFFSGRTEGKGRLRKIFSGTVDTLVEGVGTVRDGTLYLEQEVHEGNKPVRRRKWTISESSPGHYIGTLTDAKGLVSAEVQGNRLHLAFTMNGSFPTEQWLILSQDGRCAMNVMKVRKLGVTVAILSEEICRVN